MVYKLDQALDKAINGCLGTYFWTIIISKR